MHWLAVFFVHSIKDHLPHLVASFLIDSVNMGEQTGLLGGCGYVNIIQAKADVKYVLVNVYVGDP